MPVFVIGTENVVRWPAESRRKPLVCAVPAHAPRILPLSLMLTEEVMVEVLAQTQKQK